MSKNDDTASRDDMSINYSVDSTVNPTLDELQTFIDQCKELGMPGDTHTAQLGENQGYHFNGTYSFTPNGKIRASARK